MEIMGLRYSEGIRAYYNLPHHLTSSCRFLIKDLGEYALSTFL